MVQEPDAEEFYANQWKKLSVLVRWLCNQPSPGVHQAVVEAARALEPQPEAA